MVIPPPNVTGTLHLGHTLMVAIEVRQRNHACTAHHGWLIPKLDGSRAANAPYQRLHKEESGDYFCSLAGMTVVAGQGLPALWGVELL